MPLLAEACGSCHGEQPSFGAPYPLLTYDDLMVEGRYQAVLEALMYNTMPPENAGGLVHADRDTLVVWASCGALHPIVDEGLIASRPIFEATSAAPATSIPLAITAQNEPIGVEVLDDYRTFNFGNLVSEAQFIRRIEPIIDDERVLHHITLINRDTGVYYYAWAPGTGPIQFPEGGIRLTPDTELQVEIHYNNGAGVLDATDSSGLRLWIDEPIGTEWAVAAPQSWLINIAPFSSGEANDQCTVTEPFTILAGMPHMHAIGSSFSQTIERADGTEESLIELSGWSFEAQYIYEMNTEINAGDILHLHCEYENNTSQRVTAGLGSADEMCFDFLYVTPASAAEQCSGPF